jgi:hypothetical protein
MPDHVARLLTASWHFLTRALCQRLPHIHQVSKSAIESARVRYRGRFFVKLRERLQRGGSSEAVISALLQLHFSFAKQCETCIVAERCKYSLKDAMNCCIVFISLKKSSDRV